MDELIVAEADFITMAAAPVNAAPAEAMLIRGDRIAAVGSMAQVRAAAPGAEVVRLGGATVIPGLIDAHCHVTDVGYLAVPDRPAVLYHTSLHTLATRANT